MKQGKSYFDVLFVLEFTVLVVSLIVCLLVSMSLVPEEEAGFIFLRDLTGDQWQLSTVTVLLRSEDGFERISSNEFGKAWRSEGQRGITSLCSGVTAERQD